MIANLTGNLSGFMNLVPTPGKLIILPLRETFPPIPAALPYIVQFNPETLSESNNPQYNDAQALGKDSATQRYVRTPAGQFNFEFLIDGTGASGDKREVIAEILLLKETVKLRSDEHKPSFLLIVFGTFIKTAVLVDMSVQYTLFRNNGTPLRAKVNISFKEHTPELQGLAEANLLSPDLTKKYITQEGENLPLICYGQYKSPRFYLEVARANGLTNFRRLKPGRELILPPVKK